jgi:uncharacterized protein with HEPN domain
MTKTKSDVVYLAQLCDAIAKIRRYVADMAYEQFLADEKTQSAVIMQLALIGELVKHLSQETKKSVDLPWKEIAGFRDVAIHDYFSLDLDIVWKTINTDLVHIETKLCMVA